MKFSPLLLISRTILQTGLLRLLLHIAFFILSVRAFGQQHLLHQDPVMFEHIRQGLDHLYNYEFEKAQSHFWEIKKKYPAHPSYPFSQALILFTKNFPMKPSHPDYKQFDYFVHDCLKKSDAILKTDGNHPDGVFFALTANAYMALMHSFAKDYFAAISSAKKVYSYIKQGFPMKKAFPDFYYTSGLFYYYADQYPETHPMVKPLMIFFENGNRQQGLIDLNIAMLKSVYTRQEAEVLLAYVYIKYENKPAKSLEYSEKFYYNYSLNPFALSRYIEGLVFTADYDKAREMLPKLRASSIEYFKMMAEVFTGIVEEKQDKKYELAKSYYTKALQMCSSLNNKTDDAQSFCFLGLGRIAELQGDRKKGIFYYKKALDIAEYESVKTECKERVKSEDGLLQVH